ncbi:hypothetical protein TrRE_jg7113 [Triparma retinervis]|uniref:Uncharacterized protein n=1 Tax=Triparma retinervis TaxID=2557542 RepID=A0A9W6ZXP0_9STRA|nr:hypothetical protein TrRE_jg7113 [Triparma retinervis]
MGLLLWGIWGSNLQDDSLGTLTWEKRPSDTGVANLTGVDAGLLGDTYSQELGVYFTGNTIALSQPPAFPLILTWGTFLTISVRKTYRATIEYSLRGIPGQYSPYCGLINANAVNGPNGTNTRWDVLCPPSTPKQPYNDCRLEGFKYKVGAERGTVVQSKNVVTFVPPIDYESTAFQTIFTYDFKGSDAYVVNGFCTGDLLQYNTANNTVDFNLEGKIQGAWGFFIMFGLFAAFFLLMGIVIL